MAEHVTLGPDGRLSADGEAAKRLKEAAGRYLLAPSSPDLLLMIRSPAQGGVTEPPRVVLAGDLSGVALAELIEFLHQGRRTGILRVMAPGGERAVVLKDGQVRGAGSDDPSDSIGEVCVRLGMVKRAQLQEVLQEHPVPARVGRLMVDKGLIQSHDLFKAVQHQVTEIFHSILLAREGAFVLLEQPVEERSAGLQLNTQALLMDSIRRIDEMAQFRQRLPSAKLYVIRRKPAGPALEPEERQIYELCSGDRNVLDLAREIRLSEFEATKLIYHLLEGGYVATSPTPQLAPDAPRKIEPGDVVRVFNFIFKEVVTAVGQHELGGEFLATANSALKTEAATRSPFLHGLAFDGEGRLDAAALLANVAQQQGGNPAAPQHLHEALSEVMFFLLFQAGEVLTPQEDEHLATRVKDLLATIEQA